MPYGSLFETPGFFFADDPKGASAQAMRQKIALAMMMKKAAAPKTFGEGLYSIGDSISDALIGNAAVGQAAASAAAADKQIEALQRGVTPGAISESAVPAGGGQTASLAMPPGGNAPSWNQFAQEESPGGLGLSQPQAAGLVGNLQAESGAGIAPKGVVGDAGTAFGAAQWAGPRFGALKQYGAAQGIDPMTTGAQQGFMRQEMIGQGNKMPTEGGAYAALTKARTPAEAASTVDQLYERSSGEHRGRRIANAENVMASLPNPRDQVAAALTTQGGAPTAYAPTATAPAGNVTSDMPPVTGAPPPGPQIAQAAPPQIPAAPPDPRAAIQKAPEEYVPQNRPVPSPPTKPQGLGPQERRLQRELYGDVDPRVKAAAQAIVAKEQSDRNTVYENELKAWEPLKSDWIKEQEQNRKFLQERQTTQAGLRKTTAEAAKEEMQNVGLPERLALEKQELAAKVGSAKAAEKTASINTAFYEKTGRDREPFLKAFEGRQKEAAEGVTLLRNANAANKALQTEKVTAGWGGENKLQIARAFAALGNKNAAEVAAASEQYKTASDATLAYGVKLFNGGDSRVTEGDLAAAKGLTGNLELQRQSQQRLIDVMQEDMHKKIGKYEDDREAYLKGDPQHQFFKVETAKADPKMREVLMQDPDNPFFQKEFDKTYGKGAAALEVRRARRRMQREDD